MENQIYRVVIHPADEGGFWADSPDLPGMVTVGDAFDDIRPRVLEAVGAWLDRKVAPASIHFDYPVTNK